MIGLTATPFRTVQGAPSPDEATESLRTVFSDGLFLPSVLGDDPKGTLITRRILARPIYNRLEVTNLSSVATGLSDDRLEGQIDRELGRLAGRDLRRRRRIVDTLTHVLHDSPPARVLYFGPTVADAEVISFLLLQSGFRAACLSAVTHASSRRDMVKRFRDGEYQVLCNHGVLTTGFDDPRITHVVVARPTVSLVLYEQMVVGGLRGPGFGGTGECQIFSVEDTFAGGSAATTVWRSFIDSWKPHVRVARDHVSMRLGLPCVEREAPTFDKVNAGLD